METLILHENDNPATLVLGLDNDAKKGFMFARADDAVTQFPRLETDFQAFSISLLNSSDLGVIVDNSGLTTIHELTVEGALTAGNGCFGIDGANNINLTGNILLHGTDAQKIMGEGDNAIIANFSTGQVICNLAGGEVANLSELTLSDGSRYSIFFGARQLANEQGDTVLAWSNSGKVSVSVPLTVNPALPANAAPPIILNPDGSVLLASGKVTVDADGTLKAPKFQVNPDGSMQLGEALNIDQNGIFTNNGGNMFQLSGYSMIFRDGGGPIVLSEAGTYCMLRVDQHGAVFSQPVANP